MMTGEDEYVLKCELHKIAEYLRSKKLTVLGPACAPYRMINKKIPLARYNQNGPNCGFNADS